MTNQLLAGLKPTHPGEILREDILPALNVKKAPLARHLGISRTQLYDILDEKKPVTPQMALRLSKAFGTTAEFWCNLQAAYDLATLAPLMEGELSSVKELQAA